MKNYFLEVKNIIYETPEALTIEFWHPLHQAISYQAGQFLTICVEIDGQKYRRSYSMSSSPHSEASLAITIKRVTGGKVSNFINDTLKIGDSLEVLEPMGNFVPKNLDKNTLRTAVLIGAGSGITPLFSIAKSVLSVEPKSTVKLLYTNKSPETTIFKNALQDWENKSDKFNCTYIFTKNKERIDEKWFEKWLGENNIPKTAEFYICGPQGLVQLCQNELEKKGYSLIFKELFNTNPVDQNTFVPLSAEKKTVTILYERKKYSFEVKSHQTILEAALALDIDLPYSCQAGMCSACMGKCVEGEIQLDEEDGLTPEELKNGYILTCVARPKTENTVIEI